MNSFNISVPKCSEPFQTLGLMYEEQEDKDKALQVSSITVGNKPMLNRAHTGHQKPRKSWNTQISFSRSGKSYKFILVGPNKF